MTPVKDQSVCGSCWSFGTVGTLEGALFLNTGQLTRLSQQALVDCSWGFGNNGCDGGEDWRAYQWIIKHGGIPTEVSSEIIVIIKYIQDLSLRMTFIIFPLKNYHLPDIHRRSHSCPASIMKHHT